MYDADGSRIFGSRRGAARLLLALLAFELLLVALYGTVRATDRMVAWGALDRLLDLDQELSLGTWFSAAQLLAIAAVFMAAARGGPPAALSRVLALLGVGFVFLAADEALEIHESLNTLANEGGWLTALAFRGGTGIWIAVYAAVALVLAALALPALREVWRRHRAEAAVLAAGVALMGMGAVGLEVIAYQFLRDGTRDMLYAMEVAGEELLEMTGASVILYGAILLAQRRRSAALDRVHATPARPLLRGRGLIPIGSRRASTDPGAA